MMRVCNITDMKFPQSTAEFPRTHNRMQMTTYMEILLCSRSAISISFDWVKKNYERVQKDIKALSSAVVNSHELNYTLTVSRGKYVIASLTSIDI